MQKVPQNKIQDWHQESLDASFMPSHRHGITAYWDKIGFGKVPLTILMKWSPYKMFSA